MLLKPARAALVYVVYLRSSELTARLSMHVKAGSLAAASLLQLRAAVETAERGNYSRHRVENTSRHPRGSA